MATAVFVTAASPQIGGGHVLRCLALAQALEAEGITPVFAVDRQTRQTISLVELGVTSVVEVDRHGAVDAAVPLSPEVVIFDGYGIDRAAEARWHRPYLRIALDDLANRAHDCDLLVDPGPARREEDYDGLVPAGCEVLAGPSYALLRPDFVAARERALARRDDGAVRRLLVAMGYTDVGGVTRRAVEGALMASRDWRIDVVTGAGAASLPWLRQAENESRLSLHVDIGAAAMAELMVQADLAIGAGGGTALERCCLGLPSLLIVVADNQKAGAEALHRTGAARLAGDLGSLTASGVSASLMAFARQPAGLVECSRAAARLVDGDGARRVVRHIMALLDRRSRERRSDA